MLKLTAQVAVGSGLWFGLRGLGLQVPWRILAILIGVVVVHLAWERLFFDGAFGVPLKRNAAGAFATVLEMVRIGPSASNKQPWRIVRVGEMWHLYLQRTPGYAKRNQVLLGIADMQRIDMGITMCHFTLTAEELGLCGKWMVQEPAIEKPDALTEYIASWEAC